LAEAATLALPTFKGRAGWEFTDLGDFSLEAWEPAPANGTAFEAAQLLEPPAGRSSCCRSTAPDERRHRRGRRRFVLPLSVARERHPVLVEPHLGTIVPDDDAFTR
jgi:hypothetical protein